MRLNLLGVPTDPMRFNQALTSVLSWADAPESRTAHFCNAHLLVSAQDDHALRRSLATASFNATDGLPLVWMARLLGNPAERVCGPDLMLAVMDHGRFSGRRHYLYGGTPTVVEELQQGLTRRLPGLLIVGAWSPPFRPPTEGEMQADLQRIQAASPDFVWVGLGAPKQDFWVESAKGGLQVGGLMAVGAAFDFLSGNKRRAPRWMQRTGTEWLFRLASEPGRLWRRYAVTNTRFAFLAARQLVGERIMRRRQSS